MKFRLLLQPVDLLKLMLNAFCVKIAFKGENSSFMIFLVKYSLTLRRLGTNFFQTWCDNIHNQILHFDISLVVPVVTLE